MSYPACLLLPVYISVDLQCIFVLISILNVILKLLKNFSLQNVSVLIFWNEANVTRTFDYCPSDAGSF